MTDDNQNAPEAIVFDFNTEDADIDRPILKSGSYAATIKSTTQKTKEETRNKTLTVQYVLTDGGQSTKDKPISAGFSVFQRILITPTGKLTQEMISARVAKLNFAATGKKTVGSTADLWNKPVRIMVKVREAQGEYPESNEVSDVYPATPAK